MKLAADSKSLIVLHEILLEQIGQAPGNTPPEKQKQITVSL